MGLGAIWPNPKVHALATALAILGLLATTFVVVRAEGLAIWGFGSLSNEARWHVDVFLLFTAVVLASTTVALATAGPRRGVARALGLVIFVLSL